MAIPIRTALLAALAAALLVLPGCNKWFWGGAAAAGAAGGAAYEYSNKEAVEDLEEDYEEGRISREEYERRREEIEDRSLVY